MPDGSSPSPSDLPEDPPKLDELGNTLLDTLTEWADYGVRMLPNLVVAVMVLLLGMLVARTLSGIAQRALARVSQNTQVNSLLTTLTRLLVWAIAIFGALSVLRLDTVVTSMLAGVGVVGLALGFAFQDIAANLMSGVMMAISRPFRVGDLVKTTDFFGTVEHVDLRVTHLRTVTGEIVLIPNKDVYNQPMTNYTESPTRRVDLEVGIGYGDDLEKALEVFRKALLALDFRHPDRDVDVYFTGFGGSSIDLVCRVWLPESSQKPYLQARSAMIIAIKKAVDANDLNIPFPIRTLDFGSAAVGGERLDSVLRPVFPKAADD